jgi:hypothetical protein
MLRLSISQFDLLKTWSVLQPWLADRWRKNAQLREDAAQVVADGGEDSVGAASLSASFRLERLPPQSPAIALPRRG